MPQHSEKAPFEPLQECLLRGGVAPRHVRRYVSELQDHFSDLVAMQKARGYEEPDATSRARALLGDDDELAEAMLADKQFRSLTARAPWLVFGILPPLMIVALLLVIGLGMAAITIPLRETHLPLPLWCGPAAAAICTAANYAIGPLAAWFVLAAAWRQRLCGHWPVLGIVAAALFGVITTLSVVMPHAEFKGEVSVGLGIAFPALLQTSRFVVTALLTGASFLLWQVWQRRGVR